MKTNKLLLGSIAGGIAFFLLGFLLYGVIMKNMMADCYSAGSMRGEEEMMKYMPLIFVANLFFAVFLTLVLGWAKVSTFGEGMQKGALLGFLVVSGYDLGMYAMSTMMTGFTAILLDVAANVIMCGIVGGIIALILNSGKKEQAAQ